MSHLNTDILSFQMSPEYTILHSDFSKILTLVADYLNKNPNYLDKNENQKFLLSEFKNFIQKNENILTENEKQQLEILKKNFFTIETEDIDLYELHWQLSKTLNTNLENENKEKIIEYLKNLLNSRTENIVEKLPKTTNYKSLPENLNRKPFSRSTSK